MKSSKLKHKLSIKGNFKRKVARLRSSRRWSKLSRSA